MSLKKFLTAAFTLIFTISFVLGAFPVSAFAASDSTLVHVYIRTDSNPVRYDASEDNQDLYFYSSQGYIKSAEERYDLGGVEDLLVREPSPVIPDGQEVLWYEIVKDGNAWRLHGIFVPKNEVKVVHETLETGKYGNVVSAKTTIIIPKGASGDLVVPLDFLDQFDQNVSMPGDVYKYYFTVINRSEQTYSYRDSSFQVLVDGNMNDPIWKTFYEKIFSISFTRELNMSSSKDTDCGIANYMDPAGEKYTQTNQLLTDLLKLQQGTRSSEQKLYIGLNGPLMGNEYANCSFGGEMKFVLTPQSEPQEPEPGTGEKISLGIVTPQKMSVRFEDGKVYNTGDSLEIEIGKTYRFQMCSNNWDTGTYDDQGNGLCGTVVYSVRVSNRFDERSYDSSTKTFVLPKGDPVLRTDINSCFMAYRYHFTQGDYNKQTGIKNVVNTPLESLSVNLPLGSTIQSDAYKAMKQIDSKNVFIEQAEDLTVSYTDYYWEY